MKKYFLAESHFPKSPKTSHRYSRLNIPAYVLLLMDHPKLTKEKLKSLFCEVMELQVRCETFEFCAKNASPEMKHHYEACWKDCHWRLCSQIGKLWYYVCGTEQMNPWERPNV